MKKLKPHTVDWAQIDRFLASADKKLASAHKILAFDEEACLQQAYEAMLKASLGFMFSHGFRARSQPGHHIAIIDFVRARLDKKHTGLLSIFDRLRRKRNLALYADRATQPATSANGIWAARTDACQTTKASTNGTAHRARPTKPSGLPSPNARNQ